MTTAKQINKNINRLMQRNTAKNRRRIKYWRNQKWAKAE